MPANPQWQPQAKVSGLEELPGKSNYFIGNDPKKWRTNVANYAKVKYANVYPGVDLVYYGNQGILGYDFVVQLGADPRSIELEIMPDEQVGSRQKAVGSEIGVGARLAPPALRIDGNGDLAVGTDAGEVIFQKPVVYQPATGDGEITKDQGQGTKDRHFVDGRYILAGNRVTFEVASYDKTRPLVIDPTLAYSTYLGGSDKDYGSEIAVDASGAVYVTGYTFSSNFPTTPGAFQTTYGGSGDAFITKLNADGSAPVYSTYLGGSNADQGSGVALDSSGSGYVTGITYSCDFPTTSGAFQTTFGGGSFDAFISKFSFGAPGGLTLAPSKLTFPLLRTVEPPVFRR